ncbi:MAG TPA: ATP-binding protein [Candidatus Ozemobacteraceae bacterium]|nr:ATP-binding protein [Candidatus Ozemobacteraceae bacterium]
MTMQRPTDGAPVPDELTRKFATVGKLAAGIAHEINSPMQYINNNIAFLGNAFADLSRLLTRYREVLEACRTGAAVTPAAWQAIETEERAIDPAWLEAEIPRAIDQSREGVERVSKIALALKDFSHPALHDQVMSDINRGIQNTVEISRHEWKYDADLDLELAQDLPLVRCSIDEINQALLNLIVNAAQAIREKITAGGGDRGRITVSTRPDGDGILISVTDDGPGIPPAIQQRIFEPFFTTKPAGTGSGQGLSIARHVIEAMHGGSIGVSSEPGRTVFTIHLPLQRPSDRGTPP